MAIWPLAEIRAVGAAEPGTPEFGPPIYCSGGKWLHPLFDLLDLLENPDAETADQRAALAGAGELFLRDRVIGRGAAFLALRAGIRTAYADLVSDGAANVFEAAGAGLTWGERVAAIGCATEAELAGVTQAELAWPKLLARRRAARARGA
jgi:hypothetical protein